MAWVHRTGCCCRQRDERLTPRFENFVSGVFKIIRHTVHLPSFLLCAYENIINSHKSAFNSIRHFLDGKRGKDGNFEVN
jgi:hypothetical protein